MEKAETILDEMLSKVDNVIEEITSQLPNTFPKKISQSIFDGMR
jgi:serine/threonine-protein kinase HipA